MVLEFTHQNKYFFRFQKITQLMENPEKASAVSDVKKTAIDVPVELKICTGGTECPQSLANLVLLELGPSKISYKDLQHFKYSQIVLCLQ